jgi:hypothetical protein
VIVPDQVADSSSSVELEADDAVFAARGTTIDISGAGRIRLSADDEWRRERHPAVTGAWAST